MIGGEEAGVCTAGDQFRDFLMADAVPYEPKALKKTRLSA